MVENIIYAMPELILFCGILCLLLCKIFDFSPRQNIKLSFWLIIISGFLKIVFYNKTFAEQYLIDNSFSTTIDILMYICAISVLYLARRWYAANDSSPLVFCLSLLASLLLGNILTSSCNFAVTTAAFCLILATNTLLIYHGAKWKENLSGLKFYLCSALFFVLLLILVCSSFYYNNTNLNYESLKNYVAAAQDSPTTYLQMVSTLVCIAFLFGLAPFNFWRTEVLGMANLPVLAFFLLVPFPAYFALLINLSQSVFLVYMRDFSFLLAGLSGISILMGALGACIGKNIYKILACGSLFHIGVMLLSLSLLNGKSLDAFLIYMAGYLLSMYGIISALFGIKSKGEYVYLLSEISGAAAKKPYISAMITVYLFSLIGFPPFSGFVGFYMVGLNLALDFHYYFLLFLLCATFVIAYAYTQIIKALYFEKGIIPYDYTERSIYTIMLLNALLMVAISLEPDILVENLHIITEGIFD